MVRISPVRNFRPPLLKEGGVQPPLAPPRARTGTDLAGEQRVRSGTVLREMLGLDRSLGIGDNQYHCGLEFEELTGVITLSSGVRLTGPLPPDQADQ